MKTSMKIASIFAAAAMALTMAGCKDGGSNSGAGDNSGNAGNNADKTYTVGICQLDVHPALDEATRGFKDALTEKLGEKVKFEEKNATGESTNCTTICNGFVAQKVDLIMANATGALQAAASATEDIPIVATSITDYATALDIKDWSGKTGFNVTGTADLAPIDEQEKMLKEMFPDAKKVGILYCSAEPNSKYQAKLFEEALTADGIEFKEYAAADSNEIRIVASTAAAECDVLYIPTDNTIASNTEIVRNEAVPAKKPIIAGEENICAGCGVATLSISYYEIGYKTGEMAYEILVNGADPASMDIEYAKTVTKKYNAELCTELGITPPEGYTAIGA